MYTLQVLGLDHLRSSIYALLAVADFADLKCSPSAVTLALTVSFSYQSYRFVAVLQMFGPLFTILSPGGDGHHHSRIDLDAVFHYMNDDGVYLTILIPDVYSYANFIFSTGFGELQSCISVGMIFPHHEDVIQFDYEEFVAVDAAKFRDITAQFSVHNAPIRVSASPSQVKFSVTSSWGNISEIVLTSQGGECLAGSPSGAVHFSFFPYPANFFFRASFFSPLVWFFRSVDWHTTVLCFTGVWTNLLASYPTTSSSHGNSPGYGSCASN